MAKILKVSRDTVSNKLKFLGHVSMIKNMEVKFSHFSSEAIQFDEMETFEHTKLKPLSISLAVEKEVQSSDKESSKRFGSIHSLA